MNKKNMKNLYASIFYSLKKTGMLRTIFLLIALLEVVTIVGPFMDHDSWGTPMSASFYISAYMNENVMFPFMFMGFLVGVVCAGGFGDKTANYDILCGYSRWQVFRAQSLVSMGISFASTFILNSLPVLVCLLVWGPGDHMAMRDLWIRYLMTSVVYVRFATILIFLSYAIRNVFISGLFGYFFMCMAEILPAAAGEMNAKSPILASNMFFQCQYIQAYYAMGVEYSSGSFNASMDPQMILTIIISTILGGLVFLTFGYVIFKKYDFR